MENDHKNKKKGLSRRAFIKKMAYISPVVTTLVIPKYVDAAPPCPVRCSVVCANQCPPVCANQCPPVCANQCPPVCANQCPPVCPGRSGSSLSKGSRSKYPFSCVTRGSK